MRGIKRGYANKTSGINVKKCPYDGVIVPTAWYMGRSMGHE